MKTQWNTTAFIVLPMILLAGYCFGGMTGLGVAAVSIIIIQAL